MRTQQEFVSIEISTITIEDRSRDVDPVWVDALAAMFKASEMMNPVTIWKGGNGPRLVAGAHRIAANLQNGETHIAAKWSKAETLADAKILEITENIGRRELSALDRAQHLFDLKEAYEALHPETKNGAQGGRGGQTNENGIIPFSKDAAEKTGLSDSAITKAVAMWTGLSPATKAIIKGTWLANHQAGLMALAKEIPKVQAKVLGMIFPTDGKPPKALNVPDALFILAGNRALTSQEKKFLGIKRTLTTLKDEEFDAVMVSHEERIMGWVERRIGGDK